MNAMKPINVHVPKQNIFLDPPPQIIISQEPAIETSKPKCVFYERAFFSVSFMTSIILLGVIVSRTELHDYCPLEPLGEPIIGLMRDFLSWGACGRSQQLWWSRGCAHFNNSTVF
jgi:hypothetical protein